VPTPQFKTIQDPFIDPAEAATRVATLRGADIPLRKDEVYEQVGFTPPSPEDEIFEGKPAQPESLPGLPGGLPFKK
jgi:hypothetical protein